MKTYFLCGKEGFKKELPKYDDPDDTANGRPSVTSINSMASLTSNPSFTGTSVVTQSSPPANSSHSLSLNTSNLPEDWDRQYRSKKTNILEVTCL